MLFERYNSSRSMLTKSEFLTIISSEEVWNKAFTEKNIKSGFEKCGIMPCNRGVYPRTRFMQTYLIGMKPGQRTVKKIYLLSNLMNYLT